MAKKQKKPKSGFVVPSDVTPMKLTPELEKAYYVEWKVNGFRCLAHKRSGTVRLYSDQAKEITKAFPTVVKDIRQICDRNFIVDGELVITDEKGHILGRRPLAKFIGALKSGKKVDDSRVHYVYWDVLYFDDKCVMSLEQYERKKLLDDYFRSHGKAHKMPYFIVKNREEAREAIEFVANLDGSEGAIVKRLTGVYSPGKETDAWIKFRVEIELKCVTLGMLPVKGSNAVRHKLGIYVSKKEAKLIDPKYLTELDGKLVLKLGNSFNTSIKAPKGSILKIHVEEVWRHLKGGKYHYSLHKPRVMEVMEEQYATSSLADLDAAVVSRGMEVIEDAELEVQVLRSKAKPDEEGKERMVRDFPKRMQRNFEEVMKAELWCPCVVQYHYRGHRITDEERELYDIPDRYKWWLRSLHEDVRHWVPAGNVEYEKGERIDWEDPRIKDSYLEGLTVLTPTTTDPKDKDDFYAGSEVAMRGGIRVVTKIAEPSGWLYIEGIADVGEPGSTPNAPGVFLIVARLYYTVHKVSDHILRIEYKSLRGDVNLEWLKKADKQGIYIETQPDKPPKKLKNLDGLWQYQIAHIRPEEWIILLRYLKHNLEQHEIEALDRVVANKDKLGYKASAGQLQDILYYTRQNLTRGEIAKRVGLGKRTVLDYQKRLGLL